LARLSGQRAPGGRQFEGSRREISFLGVKNQGGSTETFSVKIKETGGREWCLLSSPRGTIPEAEFLLLKGEAEERQEGQDKPEVEAK